MNNSSVYIITTLYILASPLLNGILRTAGLLAPLYLLFGAGVMLLLSYGMIRLGYNRIVSIVFSVGLFCCVVFATAMTVNDYLYHGEYVFSLLTLILISSALGLIVRENTVRYTMRTFSGILSVMYLLILALSLRDWDGSGLWPVETAQGGEIWLNLARSVFAFMPLLLPLLGPKPAVKMKYALVSAAVAVILSTLYLWVFPPNVLTDKRNLLIELSKNISVGRFFQRMEFVSIMIFLIVSMLFSIYIMTVIGSLIGRKGLTKGKKRLMHIGVYLVAAICAFLALADLRIVRAFAWIAGVAVLLSVLLKIPARFKRTLAGAMCVCLLAVSLTSCMKYNEIDQFEYPLIIGAEENGEAIRFCFRTEESAYSASGDSLLDAVEAINRQQAKGLDLSQLGMVLVPAKSYDLLCALVTEIQETYVHNTVQIAVTESSITELENADFSSYSGISEFFDEYKSKLEQYSWMDRGAFDAYCDMEKDRGILVPRFTFCNGVMLIDGAVAYGKDSLVCFCNSQLESIRNAAESYTADYRFTEDDTVLLIRLKEKHAGLQEDETILTLFEQLYNDGEVDVLNVYEQIARTEKSTERYLDKISKIERTAVVFS